MVHRRGYWHHLWREAGSHGVEEKFWVQSKYVVDIAVAIERREWVYGPGQFSGQGRKQIPGAL